MSLTLAPLPFALDALSPHMSQETLEIHHGKHHKAYVDKLNTLIPGTKYEEKTLETIVTTSFDAGDHAVFNNAAQVFNHDFFWASLKSQGGGEPTGSLRTALDEKFGSFDAFKAAFKEAALGQFGSGWVWLSYNIDGLTITKTSNAETPLLVNSRLLITCDVWEHAYYVDYRNRRADFVDVFLNHLVNWDFAQANYDAAVAHFQTILEKQKAAREALDQDAA
ncbi:MAG: superoxide dismutase [Alphaproteobacteria bacterium]